MRTQTTWSNLDDYHIMYISHIYLANLTLLYQKHIYLAAKELAATGLGIAYDRNLMQFTVEG